VQCFGHNAAKTLEFYLGWSRFNVTSTGNAGRFKKSFTMVFKCYCVSSVTKTFIKDPLLNTLIISVGQ
jgi:hypothetical protein